LAILIFLQIQFFRGKRERAFFWRRSFPARGCRLVGLLALAISGTAIFPAGAQSILPDAIRDELYARATNRFAVARFAKPAEAKQSDLVATLAPLIMQEIRTNDRLASTASGKSEDFFGRLSESNGVLAVDTARPALYAASDSVELQGKLHARFTYLWHYPAGAPGTNRDACPLQGVRITLDARGQPAIWEVMTDASRASLIFVAHSLETAAAVEFGRPLAGRRYAVENSLADAPDVVVARVIEDGPVPMGPFVYLNADTRSVATVICRCMPVQADQLLATTVYELLSLDRDLPAALMDPARRPSKFPPAFWPTEASSAQRLQRCLRLPKDF